MKRWNLSSLLGKTKRGVAVILASAFVLSPVIMMGMQLGNRIDFGSNDARTVAAAPLTVRGIDNTDEPLRPFDQPIITVTFDDGWASSYYDGLPLLQRYGIPSTHYVLSGMESGDEYMTYAQIKAMHQAGHEIACHTIDHADLTTLTSDVLARQLRDCRTAMEKNLGVPVAHFASPYGASNERTIAAIRSTYSSHRNTIGDVTDGINDEDVNIRERFDAYDIYAYTVRRSTTPEQIQQLIDYTIQRKAWLVLNYHQIDSRDSEYAVTPAVLEDHLTRVNRSAARVATVGQVMDTINGGTSR